MTNEEYRRYAGRHAPRSRVGRNCLGAFLVGGAICCLGQALLDLYGAWGLDEQAAATAQDITKKCQFKVTEGYRGRMTDDDVRTYWEYKKTGAYVAVKLPEALFLELGFISSPPMNITRLSSLKSGELP